MGCKAGESGTNSNIIPPANSPGHRKDTQSIRMSGSGCPKVRWTSIAKALAVVFVILFGVELRVTSAIETSIDEPIRADSLHYMRYAANLVRFGVYSRHSILEAGEDGELQPDAFRPPGYPLFIALFFHPDLDRFVKHLLIGQSLISGAAALVLFLVAVGLGGYAMGLAVTALYATAPHIISLNANILSESLMTTLVIAFMAAMYVALKSGRWIFWILAGLVLGYAAWTRPYLTYFGLPLLGYIWVAGNHAYRPKVLALFLISALMAGGWSIYAKSLDGVDSDNLFALNVYHGIYPGMKYQDNEKSLGYPYLLNPRHEQISDSLEATLDELKQRFDREPWRYVGWYLVGKPMMFWQWSLVQGEREIFPYPILDDPWERARFRAALVFHRHAHLPIVVLALMACLLVWIPRWSVRFFGVERTSPDHVFLRVVSLMLIYGTLVHLMGAPLPRYHIPQLPLIFLMAGLAVSGLISRISTRDHHGVTYR